MKKRRCYLKVLRDRRKAEISVEITTGVETIKARQKDGKEE